MEDNFNLGYFTLVFVAIFISISLLTNFICLFIEGKISLRMWLAKRFHTNQRKSLKINLASTKFQRRDKMKQKRKRDTDEHQQSSFNLSSFDSSNSESNSSSSSSSSSGNERNELSVINELPESARDKYDVAEE